MCLCVCICAREFVYTCLNASICVRDFYVNVYDHGCLYMCNRHQCLCVFVFAFMCAGVPGCAHLCASFFANVYIVRVNIFFCTCLLCALLCG